MFGRRVLLIKVFEDIGPVYVAVIFPELIPLRLRIITFQVWVYLKIIIPRDERAVLVESLDLIACIDIIRELILSYKYIYRFFRSKCGQP